MNVSQMFPSALAKRTIKTVFISQFFTGVYHTRSSYNSTSDIYKYLCWVFPGHSVVKNPPAKQEMGQEDSLEKKMATHSSILAWEIPWTEEPSRLQFMGWQSRTRLSDWMTECEYTSPWCEAPLHVPPGHLGIVFGEIFVQVFCPFFHCHIGS